MSPRAVADTLLRLGTPTIGAMEICIIVLTSFTPYKFIFFKGGHLIVQSRFQAGSVDSAVQQTKEEQGFGSLSSIHHRMLWGNSL